MKLIIGNRNYSSWSLRGWLAAKQSGLSFEALTVHIDGDGDVTLLTAPQPAP